MNRRKLGNSDLAVSTVGLGANNFGGRADAAASRAVIDKALDLGINLIDTADLYPMTSFGASEEILGQVLGSRRKDVVIATKFGHPRTDRPTGASRAYIMAAVEASLQRLKTDWIDLYFVHQPDPKTPIEETLRTLDDLVRQGKVRQIACSNFSARQMTDGVQTSKQHGLAAFVACQDEYSLVVRDIEQALIPAMEAEGLSLIPYFPLASGLLTGKYRRDAAPPGTRLAGASPLSQRFLTEANFAIVDRLEKFCAGRGRTLLELAFAWLLARPFVASVIAGATRPEQLEQNVRAAGWALTDKDMAEVASLMGAR